MKVIDDKPLGWVTPPPLTRAGCIDGPRPCPHLTCRYHLWPEVKQDSGKGNKVKLQPLPDESCVLDVADSGPCTLERMGSLLGVTRERARQIESSVLQKLSRSRRARELFELLRKRVEDDDEDTESQDGDQT
jgi:hypothetical protein